MSGSMITRMAMMAHYKYAIAYVSESKDVVDVYEYED